MAYTKTIEFEFVRGVADWAGEPFVVRAPKSYDFISVSFYCAEVNEFLEFSRDQDDWELAFCQGRNGRVPKRVITQKRTCYATRFDLLEDECVVDCGSQLPLDSFEEESDEQEFYLCACGSWTGYESGECYACQHWLDDQPQYPERDIPKVRGFGFKSRVKTLDILINRGNRCAKDLASAIAQVKIRRALVQNRIINLEDYVETLSGQENVQAIVNNFVSATFYHLGYLGAYTNLYLKYFFRLGFDLFDTKYLNYFMRKIERSIEETEINNDCTRFIAVAQGETEGALGVESSPQVVSSSNVVISTQRVDSVAQPAPGNTSDRLAAATEHSNLAAIMDRWFSIDRIKWDSSQGRNTVLGEWILPQKPIVDRIDSNPGFLPFSMFQYFKGDLKIRVEINSNKFQQGQLQLSWYYGASHDSNYVNRKNVYNASQRPHCLISAGSSNSAEFVIPYKHVVSQLYCRAQDTHSVKYPLDMGKLILMVINPLETPSTSYKSASLNVFMSIVNPKFTGMRRIEKPTAQMQMMGIVESGAKIVSGVAKCLNTLVDANRDKPLAPAPPTNFMPQSTNAFCHTDGVAESAVPLRSNPTGVTPHPSSINEMKTEDIAGTYAFVRSYEWAAAKTSGEQLARIPASPLWETTEYVTFTKKEEVLMRMPPVSVLASCFEYWRGDLEFRFDIISTEFHTGKLMVAYIPGSSSSTISMEDAKMSTNVVFDVKETRQLIFTVPYLTAKTWWSSRAVGDGLKGVPGYVYVYVLNDLIPMDSVNDSVTINLYIRGKPGSFELSVPRQPDVGTEFNLDVKKPDESYFSTHSSMFSSWSTGFDKRKYVMFHKNIAGQYSVGYGLNRYKGDVSKCIYNAQEVRINNKDYRFRVYMKTPAARGQLPTVNQIKYFVGDGKNEPSYIVPFLWHADAKKFVENGYNTDDATTWVADGTWSQYYDPATSEWVDCTGELVQFPQFSSISDGSDVEICDMDPVSGFETVSLSSKFRQLSQCRATAQGDDVVTPAVETLDPVSSTQSGLFTFGESVPDLKSVGRKMGNYCNFTKIGSRTVVIPVVPDRLPLFVNTIESEDNIYREGLLPIILSGYRFFRGGLRFTIIFSKLNSKDTMWVSYNPSYKQAVGRVYTRVGRPTTGNFSTCQSGVVNTIFNVEVPFYRSGDYVYLQPYQSNRSTFYDEFSSLGALEIWCSNDNASVEIKYALADDARAYDFVGFPAMFYRNMELDSVAAEMQMQLEKDDAGNTIVPPPITGQAQLLDIKIDASKSIDKIIDDKKEIIDEVVDNIAGTASNVNKVSTVISKVMEKMGALTTCMGNMVSKSKDVVTIIFHCLSQLIYSILAPTRDVFIWTAVNTLFALFKLFDFIKVPFTIGSSMFTKFYEAISGFVGKDVADDVVPEAPQLPSASAQSEGLGDHVHSLASIMCSLFSLSASGTFSVAKIIGSTVNNLGQFTRNLSSIVSFVLDCIVCIKRVWAYGLETHASSTQLVNALSSVEGKESLRSFVIGVDMVCNPKNSAYVLSEPSWSAAVYTLHNYAVALSAAMAIDSKLKMGPVLNPYIKKICEKRDEVVKHKINSPVPYEPFCLYVAGESGIGKTCCSENIAINLLKKVGYTTPHEPVYTRSPGNPFWNGLHGQPIVKFDDFLQIDDASDTTVADFIALISDAKFNPAQAAIENKGFEYNPLIVLCNSNQLMPKSTKNTSSTALLRRRSFLIEAIYKPKKQGAQRLNQDTYTSEETFAVDSDGLMILPHLEFYHYPDSTNENKKSPIMDLAKLMPVLVNSYKQHVERQTRAYNQKIKQYALLMSSQGLNECVVDVMKNLDINKLTQEVNSLAAATAQGEEEFEDAEDISSKIATLIPVKSCTLGPFAVSNYMGRFVPEHDDVDVVDVEYLSHPTSCCLHALVPKSIEMLTPTSYRNDLGQAIDVNVPCKFRNRVTGQETEYDFCLVNKLKGSNFNRDVAKLYWQSLVEAAKVTYADEGRIAASCNRLFEKQFSEFLPVNSMPKEFSDVIKLVKPPVATKIMSSVENIINNATAGLDKVELEDTEISFFKKIGVFISSVYYYVKDKVSKAFTWIYSALCSLWPIIVSIVCIFAVVCTICSLVFRNGPVPELKVNHVKTGHIPIDGLVKHYWSSQFAKAQGSGCNKTYNNEASKKGYKAQQHKKFVIKGKSVTSEGISAGSDYCLYCANGNLCWTHDDVTMQSSNDELHSLYSKVASNLFYVMKIEDGRTMFKARACGLGQHRAIIPYHSIETLEKKSGDYRLVNAAGISVQLNHHNLFRNCKRIGNTGLAYFDCPSQLGYFKNIYKYLVCDDAILTANGMLISTEYDAKSGRISLCKEVLEYDVDNSVTVNPEIYAQGWEVQGAIAYPRESPGLCGSVFVVDSNKGPLVAGMHVAGVSSLKTGFAEVLVKDAFPLSDTEPKFCQDVVLEMDPPAVAKMQFDTYVEIQGALKKKDYTRMSDKTKIRPSAIQGVFPVTTQPAPLSRHDTRIDPDLGDGTGFVSPLFCGSRKKGQLTYDFDPKILALCTDDLKQKIVANATPLKKDCSKLTVLESVNGFPGLAGYDKMDLTTSEGFPWVLRRPAGSRDKQWLFHKEDDTVTRVHPDLERVVLQRNKARESGCIPSTLFQNCLKDERKPIEKCKIPGKTRVFDLSPADATISHRQYTQHFVAAYTAARLKCEHAVGINPDGFEWSSLYGHLTSFSDKILNADYSNFGPTLHFECVKAAFEIIDAWYERYDNNWNKKESMARKCMAYEIGNSLNVCGDTVYKTFGGLPSGCTLTVYLNSIVNCLYLRYMYYLILVNNNLLKTYDMSDFDSLVRVVVYGDDVIVAVKDNFVECFNSESLCKLFALHNIKFTDVGVKGEVRKYCTIEESSFLKRRFVVAGSILNLRKVMSPLDLSVVKEIPNWIHDNEMSVVEATLVNVVSCLNCAYGHGPAVFNSLRQQLERQLQRKKIRYEKLPTWDGIDMRVWSITC